MVASYLVFFSGFDFSGGVDDASCCKMLLDPLGCADLDDVACCAIVVGDAQEHVVAINVMGLATPSVERLVG